MPFPNAAAWTARGVRPPAHCTRTHAADDEDEDADVAMTTHPATRAAAAVIHRRRRRPRARVRTHKHKKALTTPAVRHLRRARRRRCRRHCYRSLHFKSPLPERPTEARRATATDTTSQRAHDARTHDANTAPHRHIDIVTATARPLGAYPSAHAAAEARERRAMSLAPTRLHSRRTPVHSKMSDFDSCNGLC